MAYLSDVRRKLAARDGLFASHEVHVLSGRVCVVAGHKGLYSLSESVVVARVSDGLLAVRGRGLRIDYADGGEICISGEILSVECAETGEAGV